MTRGRISELFATRIREYGKHRRPLREAAKRIRESARIPDDLKNIEQFIHEGLDPLHAAYASVQHFVSFFAESVSVLDEFEPYYRIIEKAEDTYMPDSPPISPLTRSYFTLWAFFDVRFGPDLETIGSCLLENGANLGLNGGMLEITRLLQDTRMGIYEHIGHDDATKVRLRELVTDEIFTCHSSAGYMGKEGELWYVRRCPPVVDLITYHLIITTPYILTGSSKADWVAYLNKQLLGVDDKKAGLRDLLKHGRRINEWNDFIFEAYHHHQHDAIFLAGLPDVEASRPHSRGSYGL